MTPQNAQRACDALYLKLAQQAAERELSHSGTHLECLAEQIEPLAAADEIPGPFTARHAEIATTLRELVAAIKRARRRIRVHGRSGGPEDYPRGTDEDLAPETLAAIRAMVERLNRFEEELGRLIQRLGERLITLPALPVRWDSCCEFKVHVAFKPVAGRACYQTDDPLELRLVPDLSEDYFPDESRYGLGDGQNHNMFQYQETHPLHGDHHGYLVHCLLEHAHLPLALLPMIENVWVEVYPRGDGLAWGPRPEEDGFKLRPIGEA